jgi:hypothetical protein
MAPRKRSKATASGSSPNTVLIIFLVFFVLLSIGLGVWAYYGYQAAKKKEAQGADIAKKAEADKRGLDWYKLQALWTKAAAGHELSKDEANDLAVGLSDLQEKKKFDAEKDKPAFDQMVKADQETLKWDKDKKKLTKNYRKEVERLEREIKDLEKKRDDLDGQLTVSRGENRKRDAKNDATWKEISDETKKINRTAEETIAAARTTINEANASKQKVINETAAEIRKLQDQAAELVKSHGKILKEKDQQIAMLKVRKEQLEAKEEKTAKTDLLSYDSPRGKIVRVDYTGKMPYINLGRADGVKEQLTFSIYGVDTNGKVDKDPKGNLEVVRIVDAHLSQGRVLHLADPSAKPLQEGDQLFNPAWNPNRKIHVAIAGIVDFTGDESATVMERVRNLREFIHNLERQNILVDAYLDLRDLSVKGPGISLQTDYFILAAGPTYDDSKVLDLKDDKVKFNQKMNNQMENMRKEAVKKGVSIIALNKFALMTGYRVPRRSRLSDPTSGYRTGVPTEKPPREKKDDNGDKKDDKKAEDDDDKKPDMKDDDDKKKGDDDNKKKGDDDDTKDDKKKDDDKKDDGKKPPKKDGKKKKDDDA